jgi:hypothetical protein
MWIKNRRRPKNFDENAFLFDKSRNFAIEINWQRFQGSTSNVQEMDEKGTKTTGLRKRTPEKGEVL